MEIIFIVMSDKRDVARRQFSQHAENYRLSRTHGNQATLDQIIQFIAPDTRAIAADVGCGGGHMAVSLAKWVGNLTAIDLSPQMLTQTKILAGQRGLSNIVGCIADAQNLPFKSEAFDIVSCRTVLHHVPDVAKAISEMGRIIRKDGKLFIADMVADDSVARRYIDEFERLRDPSHIRTYGLEDWHRFFEDAGCKITRMKVTCRKSVNLKEWTDRSGTPKDKVESIVKMVQNIPEDVGKHIKVEYADGIVYISANATGAQFLGTKV